MKKSKTVKRERPVMTPDQEKLYRGIRESNAFTLEAAYKAFVTDLKVKPRVP